MATATGTRHLAVILAADVAGYSRLIGVYNESIVAASRDSLCFAARPAARNDGLGST
jgi:hypothetical protein